MTRRANVEHYRIERELGAGAFATVWLATDELLDDRVAIKILADNWARNPDVRNRFLEEARILRHLDSDRIVRVHHIGVLPDDRPYFVMSWADRRTLHDRLRQLRQQGTYLDVETAVLYAGEIATSLQVVHDFGIVHRDVKPSNVLFRSLAPHQRKEGATLGDEALMLGDFGLAKVLTGEMGVTLAAGTPAYMAPEQAGAVCELGPEADIFAATAVTFELLTGQAPFPDGTLADVAHGRRERRPPRLSTLRSGLPPRVQDVIDRGLDADPGARFSSADDLAVALRSALGGGISPAPPLPVTSSTRCASEAGTGRLIAEVASQMLERAESSLVRALVDEAVERGASPLHVALIGCPPSTLDEHALETGGSGLMIGVAPDLMSARRADAVVLRLDEPAAEELARDLRAALGTAIAGPVLAIGAVATDAERWTPDTGLRQVLDPVVATGGWRGGVAAVAMLTEGRRDDIRWSAALALLEAALRTDDAGLSRSRRQLADRLDAIRLHCPRLGGVQVLRDELGGRLVLSQSQRDDLRRVLGGGDLDRRLGLLPGSAPEERRSAAQAGAEHWRALVNTGRITFTARAAAAAAETAYEQLWSESGG